VANSVFISVKNQTGSWQEIGAESGTLTFPVLNLEIDHGASPIEGGSYAFLTVPGVSLNEFLQHLPSTNNELVIISNTEKIQAVAANTVLGAVFWQPGTLSYIGTFELTVDKPSAVLVNIVLETFYVTVSNPSQAVENNNVTVHFLKSPLDCKLTFELPAGEFAGQSVTKSCQA